MKNLMQKLVKATLCLGVVSVSLIACEPDGVNHNVIDLDKVDPQIVEIDSLVENIIVKDDSSLIVPEESIITKEE